MYDSITTLAGVTGILMFLGYVLYIKKCLRREIEPNPLTWFMFSYGTVLLTWLEHERGASWELLILPITCSILGIVVAFISIYQVIRFKRMEMPDGWDTSSFVLDLCLTAVYLWGFYQVSHGLLSLEWFGLINVFLLGFSNFGAIPAFVPIIRKTHKEPHHERAWPWLIWSSSYVVLGVLTYLQVGHANELIIYPVVNAVLHGCVGLLALPHRRKRKMYEAFGTLAE